MEDINNIVLRKNIIDDTHRIIDSKNWHLLEYNDTVIIQKINEHSLNKYYFKSIDDKYLHCSKCKYYSSNSKIKYTPIKYKLSNIEKLYRKSKLYSCIDLLEVTEMLSDLKKENNRLKKKINDVVYTVNNLVLTISEKSSRCTSLSLNTQD